MKSINVNFNNLSESEREQLLRLVEKSNKGKSLSEVKNGEIFKIGDAEFVKVSEIDGVVNAVTKGLVFSSKFGDNNNFSDSVILAKLITEFLPEIKKEVGAENIKDVATNLTTLDGMKEYGNIVSKVTLPTLDFYRENREIFNKHNPNGWWWLSTADSCNNSYVLCVSPSGSINYYNCDDYFSFGVRPFLRFSSSIFVSCEN